MDFGEWALERAKLNVNENFLLVGILEELEDVLLLLERFLPHYFKGVLSIYKDPGNSVCKQFFSVRRVTRFEKETQEIKTWNHLLC